ncbi:MAG TPA: c-type cytochrome [Thermoanaerobaculia bacterium]|nr:c-type cytochrome [Thermoanaerobaculia bacterium]
MPARRFWVWSLAAIAAIAVAEGAILGGLALRSHWQASAGATPVARGRAVAERMGCFGCHGPGGVSGSKNPGAKGGEVPTWSGGTWMMYNDSEADLRAWILDGHPPHRPPDPGALLTMPAYRSRLRPAEADDLVAYVLAASQFGRLEDEKVAAGLEAAVHYGCLGCHGPEGRGLVADPGSLKGFVPPWDGPDYAELVESDAEFRQWVKDGTLDRFRANPAAQHILKTEALRMPAFGDRIKPEEVEALLAYAKWVRAHPRTGSEGSH